VNIDTFAIGFDHRDRERLHALWDEAIEGSRFEQCGRGTKHLGPGRGLRGSGIVSHHSRD